jgi:hypothetical protein
MNRSHHLSRKFILISLLMSLLLTACVLEPAAQKKLETLQQIAAQTPVHPSFTEIGSNQSGKSISAVLSFYYQSSASYEEIKGFYTRTLNAKNWGMPKEDTWGGGVQGITFRKGEYSISIFYDSSAAQEWNYAISYGWNMP